MSLSCDSCIFISKENPSMSGLVMAALSNYKLAKWISIFQQSGEVA